VHSRLRPSGIGQASRRCGLVVPWLLVMLMPIASAAAESPALPRVGIEAGHEIEPLARALAGPVRSGVPVAVRVETRITAPEAGRDVTNDLARIAALARAGARVWVHVSDVPAPADEEGVRQWRSRLRTLLERTRGQVQLVSLPLAEASRAGTAVENAFLLKLAAVQVRAVEPAILIAVHGDRLADAAWVEAFYAAGAAPYVDVLSLPARRPDADAAPTLDGRLRVLDPDARVVLTEEELPDIPLEARRTLVRTQVRRLGSAVSSTVYRGTSAAVAAALAGAVALGDLLAGDVVTMDEGEAGLSVRTDTTGHSVRARLFYNVGTFTTSLAYWAEPPGDVTAEVSLRLPRTVSPVVRNPMTGAVTRPQSVERQYAAGVTRVQVAASADPRIVDFTDVEAAGFTLADRAEARRELTVEEIVARHQQVQAAHDDLLESYSARARMEQHFRPTPADPGYDVVTEARFFSARDGAEWEELSFSVNGTKWGPDRPAFPLLQAEKVLALPLGIRLADDYSYTLAGTDTVDGRPCYVVAFEPRSDRQSLYRGRVWIDRERFVRLKLQTVQTRLSSPIVSNEEIQSFTPVTDAAGHEFLLFSALTARQLVLIAGRTLLIEKSTRFWDFRVNDPAFAGSREEARRSDRIMYKETDRGLRHFVKRDGVRVVSDRLTSRAKALAMGVTIDPSFGFPLPILGLNYIDFEFGNPDTQLALLFGGVLALGNVQRGKLLGGRVDASVDFFGIAVPASDRVYDAAGEREAERVLTWPMNLGMNLGWQVTNFQKVGLQYVLRFDGYARDRTTADDFVLPSSTVTNGAGLTYEWKRAGYAFTGSSLWARRAEWHPWGAPGALEKTSPDYAKYSLGLSKDVYVGPFQKIHLNAAYFGGRRLDRFTQYQFGLFDDTRMHGVPSAGVRFGELVMARGSYAFNVFDQYRLELFLDHARGRASRDAGTWDPLTGTGVSFTMRAPFRTLLRGDLGKSFLPESSRGTGSIVAQVLVLKPL
jgi:hypothetical protein